MLETYKSLLRLPGAFRVSFSGLIARMPGGMDSLAIIFIVLGAEKQYAIAGALTGVAALTTVVSTPFWSNQSDKRGQKFVLKIAIPARTFAMFTFIALVAFDAPVWTWFVAIIAAESTSVSIGSFTRRRWMSMVGAENKAKVNTAYSFESALDQFVYVAGPVLATAISTVSPPSGLILATTFFLVGGIMLLTHKESTPPILHRPEHPPLLGNRAIHAVAIPIILIGGCFGPINLAFVAFSREQGHPGIPGVLLAVGSLGGLFFALLNGAIKWKLSAGVRFRINLLIFTLIAIPLPFINSLPVLFVLNFFLGGSVGPLFPTAIAIVEKRIPTSHMTEAIALIFAGIPLAGAFTSIWTGKILDDHGSDVALWVPVLFIALGAASTLFYGRWYQDEVKEGTKSHGL